MRDFDLKILRAIYELVGSDNISVTDVEVYGHIQAAITPVPQLKRSQQGCDYCPLIALAFGRLRAYGLIEREDANFGKATWGRWRLTDQGISRAQTFPKLPEAHFPRSTAL